MKGKVCSGYIFLPWIVIGALVFPVPAQNEVFNRRESNDARITLTKDKLESTSSFNGTFFLEVELLIESCM